MFAFSFHLEWDEGSHFCNGPGALCSYRQRWSAGDCYWALKVKVTYSCPLPQETNNFPLWLRMLSMVGGWFGGLELFSLLGSLNLGSTGAPEEGGLFRGWQEIGSHFVPLGGFKLLILCLTSS